MKQVLAMVLLLCLAKAISDHKQLEKTSQAKTMNIIYTGSY